jgi:thymidylate synthase (FAD)
MDVTLIDHMGDDNLVVNAARVSFSKEAENYTEEQNGRLITFLAGNGHFTPFTHPTICIKEKVPIFVARQRFKHTIGFSYNEVSRRYVDDPPEFFTPDVWRSKPVGSMKQGSGSETIEHLVYVEQEDPPIGTTVIEIPIKDEYQAFLDYVVHLYSKMLEDGVAPEQARTVLPQSMYTEYYCTGSLSAWARAYKLRIDAHAQKEIQDVAIKWDEIIRPLFPISWSALVD